MEWLVKLYGYFGAKAPIGSLCVVTLLAGLFWQFLGYQWKQVRKGDSIPVQATSPAGDHNQNIQRNDGTATQINEN